MRLNNLYMEMFYFFMRDQAIYGLQNGSEEAEADFSILFGILGQNLADSNSFAMIHAN